MKRGIVIFFYLSCLSITFVAFKKMTYLNKREAYAPQKLGKIEMAKEKNSICP